MRFGVKGISIAAVATAVLAATACGTSGTVGASGSSSTGTSGPTSASTVKSSSPSSHSSSSAAPSTSSSASAATSSTSESHGAGSGTGLTTDQISKLLLTDKDDPGYTYDASKDETGTTDTPDTVTTGGSICQTFVDAEEGLSTKYGTTAEVDRQLTKTAEGHLIQDTILVLPSPDKALALIADLNAGIKGCKKLTMTQDDGGSGTMELSAIPQLISSTSSGYIDYLTISGKEVLMAAEVIPVGKAVSVVALIGPVTSDSTALEQMGATLGHLSNVQVGRLKTAQGTG